MADNRELPYTYSGQTMQPTAWTAESLALRQRCVELAAPHHPGLEFNSCLLNHYRDGKDKLGWHADNQELYGPTATIASVSLGAGRCGLVVHISSLNPRP